jgi:hypothetical protein
MALNEIRHVQEASNARRHPRGCRGIPFRRKPLHGPVPADDPSPNKDAHPTLKQTDVRSGLA